MTVTMASCLRTILRWEMVNHKVLRFMKKRKSRAHQSRRRQHSHLDRLRHLPNRLARRFPRDTSLPNPLCLARRLLSRECWLVDLFRIRHLQSLLLPDSSMPQMIRKMMPSHHPYLRAREARTCLTLIRLTGHRLSVMSVSAIANPSPLRLASCRQEGSTCTISTRWYP
jgi:hypothetical protein